MFSPSSVGSYLWKTLGGGGGDHDKDDRDSASDEEEDGTDIDNPGQTSKEEKRTFGESIDEEFESTDVDKVTESSFPDDSGLETATDFSSSFTLSGDVNGEGETKGTDIDDIGESKHEIQIKQSESESDVDDFTDAMESMEPTATFERDQKHDDVQVGDNGDETDSKYQEQARKVVDGAIGDALTTLEMESSQQGGTETNGYHHTDDSTIENDQDQSGVSVDEAIDDALAMLDMDCLPQGSAEGNGNEENVDQQIESNAAPLQLAYNQEDGTYGNGDVSDPNQSREVVDQAIDDALAMLDTNDFQQHGANENGEPDKAGPTIENNNVIPHVASNDESLPEISLYGNENNGETVTKEFDISTSIPMPPSEEINVSVSHSEEAPIPPQISSDIHVQQDTESKGFNGVDNQHPDPIDDEYDIEMNDIEVNDIPEESHETMAENNDETIITTTSVEYTIVETLNVPNAPVVKNAIDDDVIVEDGSDDTTSSDADTVKDAGGDVAVREKELPDKTPQSDETRDIFTLPTENGYMRDEDGDEYQATPDDISQEKSESHACDDVIEPVIADDVESSNTRHLLISLTGEEIPPDVSNDENVHTQPSIDDYIIDGADVERGEDSSPEVSGDAQGYVVDEDVIAPHLAKTVECSNINTFCAQPDETPDDESYVNISLTSNDNVYIVDGADVEKEKSDLEVSGVTQPYISDEDVIAPQVTKQEECSNINTSFTKIGESPDTESYINISLPSSDSDREWDDSKGFEGPCDHQGEHEQQFENGNEVPEPEGAKRNIQEEDTVSPEAAKPVVCSSVDAFCSQNVDIHNDVDDETGYGIEMKDEEASDQLSDEGSDGETIRIVKITMPSTNIRHLLSAIHGDDAFVEHSESDTTASDDGDLRVEDFILDVKGGPYDLSDEDATLSQRDAVHEDDIAPVVVSVKNKTDSDYFINLSWEKPSDDKENITIYSTPDQPNAEENIADDVTNKEDSNGRGAGDQEVTVLQSVENEVSREDKPTELEIVTNNHEKDDVSNEQDVSDDVIVPFTLPTQESKLNISDVLSTVPESPKTEIKAKNYFEDDVTASDVRKEIRGQYNIARLLKALDGELSVDVDLDDSNVSEPSPPKKRIITDEMVREAIRFLMMKPFAHSYGMYGSWDSLLDEERSPTSSGRTFALVSTPRTRRRQKSSTVFALVASPSMQSLGDAASYQSDVEEPVLKDVQNVKDPNRQLEDLFAILEGKPIRRDYAYEDTPKQVVEDFQYAENRPEEEAVPRRLEPDSITRDDDDSSSASSSETSGTYILDNDVIEEEEQALLESVSEAQVHQAPDQSEHVPRDKPEEKLEPPKPSRVFYITSAMLAAGTVTSSNEQPDRDEGITHQPSSSASSSSESYLEEIPPGYGPRGHAMPKDSGSIQYERLHDEGPVKTHYNDVMTARYDDDDPIRFRPISRDDSSLDPSPRQSPRGDIEHFTHAQYGRRNGDSEYSPELLEIERQKKKARSMSSSSSELPHIKEADKLSNIEGNNRLAMDMYITEPQVKVKSSRTESDIAPSRIRNLPEPEEPLTATQTTTVSYVPDMGNMSLTRDVPNSAITYSKLNNAPVGAFNPVGVPVNERDIQSEESVLSQSDYQGYSGYSSDDGEYEYDNDNESFSPGARVFALVGAPSGSKPNAIRVVGSIEVYRAEGEMDKPRTLYSYEISKGRAGPDGKIKKLQEQSFTYEHKSDIVADERARSGDDRDDIDYSHHGAAQQDEPYYELELPYDSADGKVSEREGLERQVESLSDLLSEKTMDLQRLKDDYPWLDRLMSYPSERVFSSNPRQTELMALYRDMEEEVLELMNIYKETRSQLQQLTEIESG